jgi:hypothetical protein
MGYFTPMAKCGRKMASGVNPFAISHIQEEETRAAQAKRSGCDETGVWSSCGPQLRRIAGCLRPLT